MPQDPDIAVGGVLDAFMAEAHTRAHTWFPDFGGAPVDVQLMRREDRARCFLYRIQLGDGTAQRRVVVKVRHSVPGLRRREMYPDRPILCRERTIPDRDAARREYEGLVLLERAVSSSPSPGFGVLRPLAWLPEHGAIVLPELSEPTLYDHVVSAARPWPGRPSRALRQAPWRNAGALLRRYHDEPNELDLTERHPARDEVVALCQRYRDYLSSRTGNPAFFASATDVLVDRMCTDLPDSLPLGTGHGDFVSRNVFTTAAGRITVFDPMPLWRIPVYEDMARFLTVGLRLLHWHAFAQGLLFRPADLAAYERAFLHGYFGDDPVPMGAVRAYQLILLFDWWAQTISKEARDGRRWKRTVEVGLSEPHFRREARRLVALLRDRSADAVSFP